MSRRTPIMAFTRILIANRGEIAIRIARAVAELGLWSVAVHSRAYLDGEQIIAAARQTGCEAIHPGYGFLSENAAFAQRCADAGLVFIGPRPDALALFGDKPNARALAARLGVPTADGGARAASLAEARSASAPPQQ